MEDLALPLNVRNSKGVILISHLDLLEILNEVSVSSLVNTSSAVTFDFDEVAGDAGGDDDDDGDVTCSRR